MFADINAAFNISKDLQSFLNKKSVEHFEAANVGGSTGTSLGTIAYVKGAVNDIVGNSYIYSGPGSNESINFGFSSTGKCLQLDNTVSSCTGVFNKRGELSQSGDMHLAGGLQLGSVPQRNAPNNLNGTKLRLSTTSHPNYLLFDPQTSSNVITGNTNMVGAVSVDHGASVKGDIMFNGGNNWVLHTPDNNSRVMHVAPSKGYNNTVWDWNNQTTFFSDGSVSAKKFVGREQLCVGGTCVTPESLNRLLSSSNAPSTATTSTNVFKELVLGSQNNGYKLSFSNNQLLLSPINVPGGAEVIINSAGMHLSSGTISASNGTVAASNIAFINGVGTRYIGHSDKYKLQNSNNILYFISNGARP